MDASCAGCTRHLTFHNNRQTGLAVWLAGCLPCWWPNGVKSCQLYPFAYASYKTSHSNPHIQLTPSNLPLWHNEGSSRREQKSSWLSSGPASQRVFNNCIFNSCTKCNAYLTCPPTPSHLPKLLSIDVFPTFSAFTLHWFLCSIFDCLSTEAVD